MGLRTGRHTGWVGWRGDPTPELLASASTVECLARSCVPGEAEEAPHHPSGKLRLLWRGPGLDGMGVEAAFSETVEKPSSIWGYYCHFIFHTDD